MNSDGHTRGLNPRPPNPKVTGEGVGPWLVVARKDKIGLTILMSFLSIHLLTATGSTLTTTKLEVARLRIQWKILQSHNTRGQKDNPAKNKVYRGCEIYTG